MPYIKANIVSGNGLSPGGTMVLRQISLLGGFMVLTWEKYPSSTKVIILYDESENHNFKIIATSCRS